jgi:hypothetical protein
MRIMATSTTDSVQAEAELQYMTPIGGLLVGEGGKKGGRRVRDCTVLGHSFGVDPVEACASTGVDFAGGGEEGAVVFGLAI